MTKREMDPAVREWLEREERRDLRIIRRCAVVGTWAFVVLVLAWAALLVEAWR